MKSVKEIIKEELGKIKNNLPVLEGENSKKLSEIRDLYLNDLMYEITYEVPFYLAHLEFSSNNPFFESEKYIEVAEFLVKKQAKWLLETTNFNDDEIINIEFENLIRIHNDLFEYCVSSFGYKDEDNLKDNEDIAEIWVNSFSELFVKTSSKKAIKLLDLEESVQHNTLFMVDSTIKNVIEIKELLSENGIIVYMHDAVQSLLNETDGFVSSINLVKYFS